MGLCSGTMKNIRLYGIAFLVTVMSGLVPAQEAAGQLGFSVGVNYSKLSDINLGSGSTRFEDASGWHAEVWFDMPIGPLAMRPGLRYMQAGSVFEFANDATTNFRDDFNVNMFEVPLDFRFRFNMEIATPYVAIGPVLRFPSARRSEVTGMKSLNVGGGFDGSGSRYVVPGAEIYVRNHVLHRRNVRDREHRLHNGRESATERRHDPPWDRAEVT
jgi:hypothetical protein